MTILVAMSALSSCGPKQEPRLFDPTRPIEKEKGYRQDGQPLDSRDLWKKLKEEPEAAPHIRRAEVLDVVSIALGATGGALMGWPVGEALGGDPAPHWELMAIGGGAIVVAIPFAIWSASSRSQGITVHNAGVRGAYYQVEGTPLVLKADSVGVVW